jgi:purine catabolism regulator
MKGGFHLEYEKVFTIQELLQRPIFNKAKLIAGESGIFRKVGWVHILEIPIASFTNQHDLVLTTGLGIQQNDLERMKYLKELIHQEAAGLCIELGQYLSSVPQEMIDLANQHDFPLIIFENPVRFVEITQNIHALLINQQHQMLKDLEISSRKLQQLSLKSTDVQSILRLLNEQTSSQVIYFSLIEKPKLVPFGSPSVAEEILKQFQLALEKTPTSAQESTLLTLDGQILVLTQPVICLGQTLSYVGILVNSHERNDYYALLLDHVGKAVAHVLLRKLFLKEKTLENHTQLINDILQNKLVDEEQALAQIGLQPLQKGVYLFIAGIIEIKHDMLCDDEQEIESINQDILVLLRALLKKNGITNLLAIKSNQIYVLGILKSTQIKVDSKSIKELLLSTMDQLKIAFHYNSLRNIEIRFGFGSIKQKLADAADSFKETYDTFAVSRILRGTSPFYEDLGIYQLLQMIPNPSMLTSFVTHNLGSLIEYDKQNNASLINTLKAYLGCMGSKHETAEHLFIHRQTLYHRLGKIEEILGHDFLKPEKRISLEVALIAYHFRTN